MDDVITWSARYTKRGFLTPEAARHAMSDPGAIEVTHELAEEGLRRKLVAGFERAGPTTLHQEVGYDLGDCSYCCHVTARTPIRRRSEVEAK